MIDPTAVTKFNRTQAELEEFWLFCLVVAGKTAVVQARFLESFLTTLRGEDRYLTPFQAIRRSVARGDLLDQLKLSRLGQFTRLNRAMKDSLDLNLASDTVADFEAIHGVGPKTARFFLLHTRLDQKIAVLDTHVLRHMRDLGLTTQKGTPSGTKYATLEQMFLKLVAGSNMSTADFDLMIWNKYARKA